MNDFFKSSKGLSDSMFDVNSFEAKIQVFEIDHQLMNMFEFVRCLKNDVQVRTMFDPSLLKKDKFFVKLIKNGLP